MKLATGPDDLTEGLFGQVLLYVFEVLPHLHASGEMPAWDVKSRLYGVAPDYRVLPGAFDLAYTPLAGGKVVSLLNYKDWHQQFLGNDWAALHALWQRYFRVPPRTGAAADACQQGRRMLGLHYRGTDKNHAPKDTNPVSEEDFLLLSRDFVARHPDVRSIFVATDQHSFAVKTRRHFPQHEVIELGAVEFHKAAAADTHKADRAVLDMLLLSRCEAVLKCSSALSGFAKVLNPALPIYRVSASKRYAFNPYFPNAFIDRYESDDVQCQAILQRQFEGDWVESADAMRHFGGTFAAREPGRLHKCRAAATAGLKRGLSHLFEAASPLHLPPAEARQGHQINKSAR